MRRRAVVVGACWAAAAGVAAGAKHKTSMHGAHVYACTYMRTYWRF